LAGAVALSVLGCGQGAASNSDQGSRADALISSPEELGLASLEVRAVFFEEVRSQSDQQARALQPDDLALFAVDRKEGLVPAALPAAHELLAGSSNSRVRCAEGWPIEPREELGWHSELDLAEKAAAALAMAAGISDSPIVVERAPEAPYAAVFVEGRLRLNPSLLYLAAASENLPSAMGGRASAASASCASVPGGLMAWAAAAAGLAFGIRKRRAV
jgi:hypothetical protein